MCSYFVEFFDQFFGKLAWLSISDQPSIDLDKRVLSDKVPVTNISSAV